VGGVVDKSINSGRLSIGLGVFAVSLEFSSRLLAFTSDFSIGLITLGLIGAALRELEP